MLLLQEKLTSPHTHTHAHTVRYCRLCAQQVGNWWEAANQTARCRIRRLPFLRIIFFQNVPLSALQACDAAAAASHDIIAGCTKTDRGAYLTTNYSLLLTYALTFPHASADF